jgi:hypothetical protein
MNPTTRTSIGRINKGSLVEMNETGQSVPRYRLKKIVLYSYVSVLELVNETHSIVNLIIRSVLR